jgi:peptide deformylase
MILPIVAYGHPVLKKPAKNITSDYEGLTELIANMWETMYEASGVGLAAPQINKSIRLFIIDASPYGKDHPETKDFKKVFINAEILSENGEPITISEGCLSRYQDENFETHQETYSGILARIIQHEYDHIDGILYVDRLPALKKMLLKGKLRDISEGKVDVEYRMIFPKKKKKVR